MKNVLVLFLVDRELTTLPFFHEAGHVGRRVCFLEFITIKIRTSQAAERFYRVLSFTLPFGVLKVFYSLFFIIGQAITK